ncbi:unnamed protein product, partial [Larinioides sclopetarius]
MKGTSTNHGFQDGKKPCQCHRRQRHEICHEVDGYGYEISPGLQTKIRGFENCVKDIYESKTNKDR